MNKVATILVLLLTTGCIETGGDGSGSTVVPDLDMLCNFAVCATSRSAVMWAGWTADTSTDCETLLLTLTSANSFDENFDAWGTGTIFIDGGFQRAFITEWFDINDGAVAQLNNGTYKLCGFYDTNGNDQLDLNEGFAEATINLEAADSPLIFDSWDFTD